MAYGFAFTNGPSPESTVCSPPGALPASPFHRSSPDSGSPKRHGIALHLLPIGLFLLLLAAFIQAQEQSPEERAIHQATSQFLAGQKALEKGNLDEADTRFLQALSSYPKLPGALLGRGLVALRRGRPTEAIPFFRQARDSYSAACQSRNSQLIRDQNEMQDYVQAGKDAERIWGTGGCAWPERQHTKADEQRRIDGRRVVQESQEVPSPPDLFLFLSQALLQTGKAQEAEDEARAGLAHYRRFAPLHLQLALVLYVRQHYQESAQAARSAQELGLSVPADLKSGLARHGQRLP